MYLVSACLLGIKTRFDGGENLVKSLLPLARQGILIPVCPEQLGGLSTPRLPAEISGPGGGDAFFTFGRGQIKPRVLNKEREDITEAYLKGAREVLHLARLLPIRGVILKQGSPSCGTLYIYDGSFTGKKIKGQGVTAALLASNGYPLFDEKNCPFGNIN